MYSVGFSPQIFPSLSGRQLQLLSLEIKDGRRLTCAALEVQDEKSPHQVTGHLGLQQPLRELYVLVATLGSRKTGRKQRGTHDIGGGSARVSGGHTAGVRVQQARGTPARPGARRPGLRVSGIGGSAEAHRPWASVRVACLGKREQRPTWLEPAKGKWLETRSGRWQVRPASESLNS